MLSEVLARFPFFSKKRREFRDYKQSNNSSVYEKVASELDSHPQHVYEIAHGKPLYNYDDRVIYDRLCQYGILHRR